jgi:hypothetical protein
MLINAFNRLITYDQGRVNGVPSARVAPARLVVQHRPICARARHPGRRTVRTAARADGRSQCSALSVGFGNGLPTPVNNDHQLYISNAMGQKVYIP